MATNIIIGGQIYIPGEALSLRQMQAIQLSIALGTNIFSGAAAGTLEAQAYAQYVAQGGQQFIANAIASGTLPTASSGDIVGNANLAREENANPSLPTQPPQIITLAGRIQPAGSGADGVGQISGTNAEPTPTKQNTPTVGTNDAVRPISQTQAINSQEGQLIPVPNTQTSINTQASVRAIDNAIAATGGPGAGTNPDAGGTNPAKTVSPFTQYRAQTQSFVYQANEITSVFRNGKFEQVLKGTGYWQSTANTTQTNAQQRQETATAFDGIPAGGTKTNQTRPPATVGQLPMKQQAAIASGTDPNTVNDQGMAFGGGGL
jgi:hypothetical protein